jgi:hypothetical protein
MAQSNEKKRYQHLVLWNIAGNKLLSSISRLLLSPIRQLVFPTAMACYRENHAPEGRHKQLASAWSNFIPDAKGFPAFLSMVYDGR